MNKGTHFSGQPMYGQLINLLSKDEILKFSHNRNGE
ncbi:transposase, partial [Bacteroides caccae]